MPLIIWPSFISELLKTDQESSSCAFFRPSPSRLLAYSIPSTVLTSHFAFRQLTALEMYFARSLGFALLSIGLMVVVLSGAVPLTSSLDGEPPPIPLCFSKRCVLHANKATTHTAPESGISPYASAVLLISTFHHTSSGFYCYSRYTWTGQTGYLLGCIGSSLFAVAGLGCVMFAGDTAMISKNHHFDQSTSGFPFKNTQSYRAKKKAL